jgi:hypothetical protein
VAQLSQPHRGARPDIREIRRIIYGFEENLQDKPAYVARYERHNAEVLAHFAGRPRDLLVLNWENGDGWPELCRFLGKKDTKQPLSHHNAGRYRPWHSRLRALLLGNGARKRLRSAS